MIVAFSSSLYAAACATASVIAWIIAILAGLALLGMLALALGALFDLGTRLLVWWWKLTGHAPANRLERILSGEDDGV